MVVQLQLKLCAREVSSMLTITIMLFPTLRTLMSQLAMQSCLSQTLYLAGGHTLS